MQNATRIKIVFGGGGEEGADVSRERALSFLFRTKKVEVRGVDVGKILLNELLGFLPADGRGAGRVLGGGGYGSTVRSTQ